MEDEGMQHLEELSGGHPNDKRTVGYVLRGATLNPDEVTRVTGLRPDKSWHIGDKLPISARAARDSLWMIDSGLPDTEEFHRHVAALLARMRPSWKAFVAIGAQHSPYLEVSIRLYEAHGPLVVLLPEFIRELAELNARVVFDLYALPEQSC